MKIRLIPTNTNHDIAWYAIKFFEGSKHKKRNLVFRRGKQKNAENRSCLSVLRVINDTKFRRTKKLHENSQKKSPLHQQIECYHGTYFRNEVLDADFFFWIFILCAFLCVQTSLLFSRIYTKKVKFQWLKPQIDICLKLP